MTTEQSDAQLLRDIEEHMRKMWDARLLPADCWPAELAQRLTQAVSRGLVAPLKQGGLAELKRLAEICPELNMANYGPDDVDELNNWAVEIAQCAEALVADRACKPLTDSEIESATGAKQGTPLFLAAKGFAIAIERAHGIKEA